MEKLNKKEKIIIVFLLLIVIIFGSLYIYNTRRQMSFYSKVVSENYSNNPELKMNDRLNSLKKIIKYQILITSQKFIDPATVSYKNVLKYNCDNNKNFNLIMTSDNLAVHLDLDNGNSTLMYPFFNGGLLVNKSINTFLILNNTNTKVIERDSETYLNCVQES